MMIPLFLVTQSADIKAQTDHQKQSFHSKDRRSPHHERQTTATSVLARTNIISVTFANDLERYWLNNVRIAMGSKESSPFYSFHQLANTMPPATVSTLGMLTGGHSVVSGLSLTTKTLENEIKKGKEKNRL
jgi:hypothetical protein